MRDGPPESRRGLFVWYADDGTRTTYADAAERWRAAAAAGARGVCEVCSKTISLADNYGVLYTPWPEMKVYGFAHETCMEALQKKPPRDP